MLTGKISKDTGRDTELYGSVELVNLSSTFGEAGSTEKVIYRNDNPQS